MDLDRILGMKTKEAKEYLSHKKCKIKLIEKTKPPFRDDIESNLTERIVSFKTDNAEGIKVIVADFRI